MKADCGWNEFGLDVLSSKAGKEIILLKLTMVTKASIPAATLGNLNVSLTKNVVIRPSPPGSSVKALLKLSVVSPPQAG